MKQLNQRGMLNTLLIPLIVVSVLLAGAGSFAIWSYMSRQDYKNNTDQKIAAAVKVAEQKTSTEKDNEFIEKEKLPLRNYNGPSAFESLVIMYPKTWSAYVSEKANGAQPIDGYFQPTFVPSLDTTGVSYALRVQLTNTSYADTLKQFDAYIKQGKVTSTAYSPAKVPSVTGVRLDGQITPQKTGAMVIVPVRDKTLKIWTESTDYVPDFNNNILPNYSFAR